MSVHKKTYEKIHTNTKIKDSAIKTKGMFINRLLIILFFHLVLLAYLN